MTYDLTLERLIDAPPEVVFDTIVDPEAQPEVSPSRCPDGSCGSAPDSRGGRGARLARRFEPSESDMPTLDRTVADAVAGAVASKLLGQ